MSVIKHTDPVPDPRAVNQDKKNMLFSVSGSQDHLRLLGVILQLKKYPHPFSSSECLTIPIKAERFCCHLPSHEIIFIPSSLFFYFRVTVLLEVLQ